MAPPSPQTTVQLYPFQIHSIALSSFASIVGPFGGFFASGFKRAFKIKVARKENFMHIHHGKDDLLESPVIQSYKHVCCFCLTAGFCQHDPGSRRHHGQVRLSVPHGHLCERLHRQLHQVNKHVLRCESDACMINPPASSQGPQPHQGDPAAPGPPCGSAAPHL